MPRTLTRKDSFRLLGIFCFGNHYSIPLSTPCDGICLPGLAWAVCAGWCGSINHAETILLVFSCNGSYTYYIYVPGCIVNAGRTYGDALIICGVYLIIYYWNLACSIIYYLILNFIKLYCVNHTYMKQYTVKHIIKY